MWVIETAPLLNNLRFRILDPHHNQGNEGSFEIAD